MIQFYSQIEHLIGWVQNVEFVVKSDEWLMVFTIWTAQSYISLTATPTAVIVTEMFVPVRQLS